MPGLTRGHFAEPAPCRVHLIDPAATVVNDPQPRFSLPCAAGFKSNTDPCNSLPAQRRCWRYPHMGRS